VSEDQKYRHIYIREAAELVNRRMGTLRKWEQTQVLPVHLRSKRGIRNWRYWTPDQIDGIREWIRETDRRSGKALKHWNPNQKQLDAAIKAMRKTHTSASPNIEEMEMTG
jgi:hypothetical protein